MIEIDALDEAILKYLLDNPGVTSPAIAQEFNLPQSTVYGRLMRLKRAGFVNAQRRRLATYQTTQSVMRDSRGRVWRKRKELPYVN